jgi:large subunit ribosomal protein L31
MQKGHTMKKGIHPELVDCTVTCACGNSFVTKSQKPEMRIDICNECHPFFTGEERMVDTAGRIEKFNARYGKK